MYVGIDPTAPSMHVGHMLPFMVLAWGYVWGLPVTFLVGQLDWSCLSNHSLTVFSLAGPLLESEIQQAD